MVPVLEVGAADRTLKQDVADKSETGSALSEDNVSGSVAGAVQNFEAQAAKLHNIAFLQPPVRQNVAQAGQAVRQRHSLDRLKQEPVADVRTDQWDRRLTTPG